MPIKQRSAGYTLLELLCALSILSLLIAAAIPCYRLVLFTQTENALRLQLTAAVRYARDAARMRSSNIILCPAKTTRACSQDWRDGLLIFIASTKPSAAITSSQVLHYQPIIINNHLPFQLAWQGFPRSSALVFSGFNSATGQFTLTLAKHAVTLLTINRIGRLK